MSDAIEKLKKAKEMLDLGIIDQAMFDEIRSQEMSAMGMQTQSSSQVHFGEETRIDGFEGVFETQRQGKINFDTQTKIGSEGLEIGQYKIIELLGAGGMGSVFRGRHKNPIMAEAEGDVAIKLIKPELAKDPHLQARFVKEAALGKKISHPNIAKVITYHEDGEHTAFIMEYIEGKELAEMIPKGGLSIEEALRYLRPIAEAIDVLHSQGIIHRDLKPANIKIRPDGRPVILDFGIAKEENTEASSMTKTGTAMGTEKYMAPEQMNAKHVGPKADQYSFALIAYELFSGRLPWEDGITGTMISVAKLTNTLQTLDSVSSLGTKFSASIMKALHLEAEQRYESCSAFLSAMEKSRTEDAMESTEFPAISLHPGVHTKEMEEKEQSQKQIDNDASQNRELSSVNTETIHILETQHRQPIENRMNSTAIQQDISTSKKMYLISGILILLLLLFVLNSSRESQKNDIALGQNQKNETEQESSFQKEQSAVPIPKEFVPKFTTKDVETFVQQWDDALNRHDFIAYSKMISDISWYYLTPLSRNEILKRNNDADKKDPYFSQSIMNIQIQEKRNGLYHVSFLKRYSYKGQTGSIESFLWVKEIGELLLIVRTGEKGKNQIKKPEESFVQYVGNFDGVGADDQLVLHKGEQNSDGSYNYQWWLFTDNEVETESITSYSFTITPNPDLAVSGMQTPFVKWTAPYTGTCYQAEIVAFVQADQHHTTLESLFDEELCGIQDHDWFIRQNNKLLLYNFDEKRVIFPKER